MNEKLNSKFEKQQHYVKTGEGEHWMYVKELKELLNELPDEWWVTPNTLGHLAIHRMIKIEGHEISEFRGIIDFFHNDIDTFGIGDKEV